MNFIVDILITGLAYSILAMGISITFKVLNVADLTVDGSFPLGSVVAAVAIINGMPVIVALGLALIAGTLAGLVTGWLHVKLNIQTLLSGILTMSGLYTINLLIGDDRANIALFNEKMLFSVPTWFPKAYTSYYPLIVLIILVGLIQLAIEWFLKTKRGYMLKVAGDNPQLVISLGEDLNKYKYLGLALSNGIIALSGAIVMMLSRYYDLSMGSGMLVVGLASVVLGDTLLHFTKAKVTTIAIVGALLYRFSIAIALSLNMHPSFLKLLTVVIFVAAIVIQKQSWGSITKKLGGQFNASINKHPQAISSKHSK
ncbi:MAG: ABC transporter permease [Erysipelothrix sp.]|jgi:putative ABC transport system permease protein|nr:ABC transporter permease [Erysipelothrix sp.]